ncbi:hypothetical protein HK097_004464 [Rhizophlyctis rosea]|uniref:UBC core domain-containing protein n=1 Tax=Rhizophlyctis rosea TaxID=64517 RepID=A0AAD5S2N3_9FUNG|nr:hypothetical protein HK097_004464 [Rhizophlyctis rosea]
MREIGEEKMGGEAIEEGVLKGEFMEAEGGEAVRRREGSVEKEGEVPDSVVANGAGFGVEGFDDEDRWVTFKSLERAPESHHHYNEGHQEFSRIFHQRVRKEWMILNKSLPDGILVRVFEDRIDLLRVLMVGPEGTPYDHGLFLFDMSLPAEYPQQPPSVYFHSWTSGMGRLNPNLYEDGKILVSIQGLVLVRNPYFNEAGYERQVGTAEGAANSLLYNERTYLLNLKSISHVILRPPDNFADEVAFWFRDKEILKKVIQRAEEVLTRSEADGGEGVEGEEGQFPVRKVSVGGVRLLRGNLEQLRRANDRLNGLA